jgi:hypothetical protein
VALLPFDPVHSLPLPPFLFLLGAERRAPLVCLPLLLLALQLPLALLSEPPDAPSAPGPAQPSPLTYASLLRYSFTELLDNNRFCFHFHLHSLSFRVSSLVRTGEVVALRLLDPIPVGALAFAPHLTCGQSAYVYGGRIAAMACGLAVFYECGFPLVSLGAISTFSPHLVRGLPFTTSVEVEVEGALVREGFFVRPFLICCWLPSASRPLLCPGEG